MNEKQTTDTTIRPTKKQREILTYIEQFIQEHGYSPSYREIMNGLQYTSVATVSLHVNSLIRRGHLRKRDRSARSLEVVNPTIIAAVPDAGPASTIVTIVTSSSGETVPDPEIWLRDKVSGIFAVYEQATGDTLAASRDDLMALVHSLKVLGLSDAAAEFGTRLARVTEEAA
ncbi:MAG TPA: hypothetical protein VF572_06190 [Candidatus Saccharimonadales bacterium]|jgi:hypothetical protein